MCCIHFSFAGKVSRADYEESSRLKPRLFVPNEKCTEIKGFFRPKKLQVNQQFINRLRVAVLIKL